VAAEEIPMIPSLIGLTGRARHGKDTVGSLLGELAGFRAYQFSAQLKEMARRLNPIVASHPFPKHPNRLATLVQLMGWDAAKENPEVRRILQVLGTECVRDMFGEDAWIRALEKKLLDDAWDTLRVVITDVRFPNEAKWIHRWGGQVWRVKRIEELGYHEETGELETRPYENGVGVDHPSERFVDDLIVDKELVASSVEGLRRAVEGTLAELSSGS
jgi:hypothetical protein